MKRRTSGLLLSLLMLVSLTALMLVSLTACGTDVEMNQGSHSAVIHGVYGSSSQLVDLPVQEPEDGRDLPGNGQSALDGNEAQGNRPDGKSGEGNASVEEDGWYSSKEEVALYIHLYGELPGNYVTKAEAEDAGWTGGSVERWTGEGTALGGSYFGNYEGLLPKEQGRTYAECDVDTVGENSRGAKRIVFSNDGLIYYTEDHYESFELLYGEP